MLTSLVSLQQGNVKKPEKSMKIVNSEGENLNDLRNFNEIFRKNIAYDNIKSHIILKFTLSQENTFLKKPQGVVKLPPSAFLRLRLQQLKEKSFLI